MSSPGTTNLVVWYAMDTGALTTDSHSGGHTLTNNNSVTEGTGVQGACGDFEEANSESLSVADHADFSFGDEDFSLCAWVKFESKAANSAVAGKYHSGSNDDVPYVLQYRTSEDRLRWHVGNGGGVNVKGTDYENVLADQLGSPSTGTWYFVACWHDSTANEIGIQVNNGTADTQAWTGGSHDEAGDFAIGKLGTFGGQFWDGLVDQLCIYSKALSAPEREWLYNSGSGRAYSELLTNPGTANLESWWSLDGDATDAHGSNDLTQNNTPTWGTAGKQSTCVDLESLDSEYLSIADNASLSITGDLTIAAWFKAESFVNYAALVSKYNTASPFPGYMLRIVNSKIEAWISGTSWTNFAHGTTLSTGTWYFAVLTYDAATDTAALVLDAGAPVTGSHSGKGDIVDSGGPLWIGRSNGGANFDGLIDEVCIYRKVLSADEISWLYNSGSGRAYSELTAAAATIPLFMATYRRRRV